MCLFDAETVTIHTETFGYSPSKSSNIWADMRSGPTSCINSQLLWHHIKSLNLLQTNQPVMPSLFSPDTQGQTFYEYVLGVRLNGVTSISGNLQTVDDPKGMSSHILCSMRLKTNTQALLWFDISDMKECRDNKPACGFRKWLSLQ